MKDTLKLYIKNDYFYLETKYTDFPNLQIKNKKGSFQFEQFEKFKWKIPAKEISTFLTPN